VPLCGKTLDIAWLLTRGCHVIGVELSEVAVAELFDELGVEPESSRLDQGVLWRSEGIDVFVGDIFDLTREHLGRIDAIYDRAALVALPEDMRRRYAAHVIEITDAAPQFLLCFEYDQDAMRGPPFSISDDEVGRHYGDHYELRLVAEKAVAGGLKGKVAAVEKAWVLERQ
jgi:thiopurine S-methyltransferase